MNKTTSRGAMPPALCVLLYLLVWGVCILGTVTFLLNYVRLPLPVILTEAEANTAGFICLLLVFLIPGVFAVGYPGTVARWRQHLQENAMQGLRSFHAPSSRGDQQAVAKAVLVQYRKYVQTMTTTSRIDAFTLAYNGALESAQKLLQLRKVDFKGFSPADMLEKTKGDYQWRLCDTIERAKERATRAIRVTYRNSAEFQQRECKDFRGSLEALRPTFSEETARFADAAILEVEQVLGTSSFCRAEAADVARQLGQIDGMTSREFRSWCAATLQSNGFQDVKLTAGDGGQGVDITARKDEIRYAIQCRCAAKDLGNGPVQEVHTGKAIYRCQIGAVMTNRAFTEAARAAAEATGTLLWDRDRLTEMTLRSAE